MNLEQAEEFEIIIKLVVFSLNAKVVCVRCVVYDMQCSSVEGVCVQMIHFTSGGHAENAQFSMNVNNSKFISSQIELHRISTIYPLSSSLPLWMLAEEASIVSFVHFRKPQPVFACHARCTYSIPNRTIREYLLL